MFGKAFGLSADQADATVPLMKGVLEAFQPINRAGLPEDIARAALWLASDESSFVNGHALVVDGGLTGGQPWSETQRRRARLREALGLAPEEERRKQDGAHSREARASGSSPIKHFAVAKTWYPRWGLDGLEKAEGGGRSHEAREIDWPAGPGSGY